MNIYYAIVALLIAFVVIAVLYGIFQARKSQKHNRENRELRQQIDNLKATVERLKNRRMTASGGLPREVKQELEDIRAKMSMMDDPLDEFMTRFEDVKRDIQNLMHRR